MFPQFNIVKRFFHVATMLVLLASAQPIAGQAAAPPTPDQPPDNRSRPHQSALAYVPEFGGGAQALDIPTVPSAYSTWSAIAFYSYRNSDYEIYQAAGDGSSQIRLTNSGGVDFMPAFNRGGTKIAFSSRRDSNYEIYTMNADGSGQTRLTFATGSDYRPQWSPDGTKIAFYSYRDGSWPEIYVMNANGGGQTRLTYLAGWDGQPAWSPDGTKLIFTSDRSGANQYELWVMNADGSNPQRLTYGLLYANYPEWSPDGTRITFNDDFNNDGWQDLATINADGTGLAHPIGASPSQVENYAPTWAPDGLQIAFSKIQYIYDQGNWYWTTAYIYGLNLSNNSTYTLIGSSYDWRPNWKTTDVSAPTSQVGALPAALNTPSFNVVWSGIDVGNAGLRSYDVQYRDGIGGAWTDWQLNTTQTQATFTGQEGHTYYFQARARDNAFNLETYPGGDGDTSTTLDATAPTSSATSPIYSILASFQVSWTGSDNLTGISNYDVQYRDGIGDAWTDWQLNTTQTQATFTGQDGRTYYFRSRAHDYAGNTEAYLDGAGDAATLVDLTAPNSSATSPASPSTPTFGVTWSGTDTASGIANYDVQVRDGITGTWTNWVISSTTTSALFVGQPAHIYYFQSRARDKAGWVEAYPGNNGDTSTQTPLYAAPGYVLGNRNQPIFNATVQGQPLALNTAASSGVGAYNLYFNQTGVYSVTASRTGYGTLPPALDQSVSGTLPTLYLPPADDHLLDGHFESDSLSAWNPSGDIAPAITQTAHTGSYAATLGGPLLVMLPTPLEPFTVSVALTTTGGEISQPPTLTVQLPENALTDTTTFTLTNNLLPMPALPAGQAWVGPYFGLMATLSDSTPLTMTLLPMTFTVSYEVLAVQAAQIVESSLALWRYDEVTTTWFPLTGTVDMVSHTVTVLTEQLGTFVLAGEPTTGPWASALAQTISPTLTTTATLSLLYQVVAADAVSDTLEVVIEGSNQTLTYTLPLTTTGWSHVWWEVPADMGTSLTVRMTLWQADPATPAIVVVDEVTLGTEQIGSYPIFLPIIRR